MAASLTRLSRWLWRKKEKEVISNGSTSSNSSSDWGPGQREPEVMKFPANRGAWSSRKAKKKWQSREEMRIDREFDVVLVPSDSFCLSGSESDDSDWSIGWSEPHGSGIQTDEDDESDNSFAVLVPCYRGGGKEAVESPNTELWSAIKNLPTRLPAGKELGVRGSQNSDLFYDAEEESSLDGWLSSLRKIGSSK